MSSQIYSHQKELGPHYNTFSLHCLESVYYVIIKTVIKEEEKKSTNKIFFDVHPQETDWIRL